MSQISVIIPVFNAEKTLARCLDSVAKQTFQDYEVWLVNDGSTDGSLALCRDYCREDRRFKLLSQDNRGPAAARNAGIDHARGRYLYFVDADDTIDPEALSKLYRAAVAGDAEVTVCGLYHIRDGVKRKRDFSYRPGLYEGDACRRAALDVLDQTSARNIPPFSGIRLIRRDVLENPRLRYREEIQRTEDYLFVVELHFRINCLCLISNEALYHYIRTQGSITDRYVSGYWSMMRQMFSILSGKLPQEPVIQSRLDSTLIFRSRLALNNASKALNSEGERAREVTEILTDPSLASALAAQPFWQGFRKFGLYFLLMRTGIRWPISLRYRTKGKAGDGRSPAVS